MVDSLYMRAGMVFTLDLLLDESFGSLLLVYREGE
jgi:hypothetical protein